MKINKPHNFLLLALTAVLSCCSGEDCSDITVSGSSSAAPLSITVTDGGYASLSGGTSTRASEAGYRTVFTEGDQIGIFAVKDGTIAEGISNLCLTAHAATDANAALTWKSADNKTPFNIVGATYYAYYPYKPYMYGNPQASDAAGFFADIIRNWRPATDQNTYAKYTAQDLMIAESTPTADGSGKSLSFSMRHQMALVVIEMPFIKYSFTNLRGSSFNYIIDFSDKKFNDFTPYRTGNGIYRYLVKPPANGTLLSGSYTGKYGLTRWKFDTKDALAGNYKIYKVDNGSKTSVQKDHELKVGDFFMKDGSLIAGTKSLTAEQEADCIGIVFWIGNAAAEDQTLKNDHPDCTHGLVVALKKGVILSSEIWQKNPISVQDWLDVNRPNKYLSVLGGTGSEDPFLNNIQGYNNTKAIEEFNSAMSTWHDRVEAVSSIVSYRKVSTPVHTSDWYLPSVKELALLCGKDVDIRTNSYVGTDNRKLIEKKLSSLGYFADPLWDPPYSSDYWSSTGYSIDTAFSVNFNMGDVHTMKSNRNASLRAILAF